MLKNRNKNYLKFGKSKRVQDLCLIKVSNCDYNFKEFVNSVHSCCTIAVQLCFPASSLALIRCPSLQDMIYSRGYEYSNKSLNRIRKEERTDGI